MWGEDNEVKNFRNFARKTKKQILAVHATWVKLSKLQSLGKQSNDEY